MITVKVYRRSSSSSSLLRSSVPLQYTRTKNEYPQRAAMHVHYVPTIAQIKIKQRFGGFWTPFLLVHRIKWIDSFANWLADQIHRLADVCLKSFGRWYDRARQPNEAGTKTPAMWYRLLHTSNVGIFSSWSKICLSVCLRIRTRVSNCSQLKFVIWIIVSPQLYSRITRTCTDARRH